MSVDGFLGVFLIFFVANIVLVIWALVDAIRVPDDSRYQSGTKLVWVLVIVFLGMIGAIVYFVAGRPRPGGGRPPVSSNGLPPPPPA